ncbi:hypothetical protein [Escherichia coli]|uniref:hypothetical protein n=1 Tax=Escherichia coli TaxID=562 RepID=UPI000A46AD70|nr:hypothetical protein [Escherichia coli]EIS3497643.1 hypothetical protein [Escherichia coli]EJH4318111.1 hypothetical protein [Escherichia coli]EKF1022530.1 hypothetical protein [Escherichia coli]ELE8646172.1 hypothetical protein [Escherichia coli]ELN8686708.1 hypothetical protein [Escherichia coli]
MIPYSKVESLAACRMTAQQIAGVLDVDLNRLKENREAMTNFYASIRKGRAKGEAELRAALFKLARKGDAFALRELLRVDKNQD